MKIRILLFLGAIFLVQYANSLPRPHLRIRRAALRLPRATAESSEEELTSHDRVLIFAIEELTTLANHTVESHKKFFDRIVEEGAKQYLNNAKIQQELRPFSEFSRKVEILKDMEGEEYIEKLFDLFGETTDLTDPYDLDDKENPTEAQRKISKLMEEEGLLLLNLEFLGHFAQMRNRFTTYIQNYIDSLSQQERRDETKMIRWFRKFKREQDLEKNIEVMMEFFELYDK